MTTAISTSVAPPVRRARLLGLIGKAPWAVGDQILISGANMITTVMLARGLAPEAFGAFVLVFSALLFANSIQGGLITQAHNVIGAGRKDDDYRVYTTSTAVSQLLLSVVAALLSVIAAWIAFAMKLPWAGLALFLAPAVFFWQMQEFFRRVLYTENRIGTAFANDIVCYGGQAVAIAWLWWTDSLTAELAMLSVAVTSFAGSVLGVWQIRASLTRRISRRDVVENWHFGKWLAGSEIVSVWISSQLFVILTASMVGAAAAAVLRAGYTLFGPARMLSTVFRTTLPIRFSKALTAGGGGALSREMRSAFTVVTLVMGGYCLFVALLANPLMKLAFGDRYAGYGSVVAIMAFGTAVSYVTMVVVGALKACRMTREVFTYRITASLVAIPIGVGLILAFGIHGAVLGTAVSYLTVAVFYHRIYHQRLKTLETPAPNSPPSQGGAGEGSTPVPPGALDPHSNAERPTLPQPLPKREGGKAGSSVFAVSRA